MNVEWLIPCRYVEVHDNLGTLVGAGADTAGFAEFPADVQITFGVAFSGMAEEFDGETEHVIRNVVYDPAGNVIDQAEQGGVRIGGGDPHTEGLNTIVAAFVVLFRADTPGAYQVEHSIDGRSKSIPIHVVQTETA